MCLQTLSGSSKAFWLGPGKDNGGAAGDGDVDGGGGYFAERFGVVDSRMAFFVVHVCVCAWKRLSTFKKPSSSQAVNSRAGYVSLRGGGCLKQYSIKQLFPLRLRWEIGRAHV